MTIPVVGGKDEGKEEDREVVLTPFSDPFPSPKESDDDDRRLIRSVMLRRSGGRGNFPTTYPFILLQGDDGFSRKKKEICEMIG